MGDALLLTAGQLARGKTSSLPVRRTLAMSALARLLDGRAWARARP